jgi:hypothetical protein
MTTRTIITVTLLLLLLMMMMDGDDDATTLCRQGDVSGVDVLLCICTENYPKATVYHAISTARVSDGCMCTTQTITEASLRLVPCLRWQGDVAEVDVSGVDVFLCICTET